MSDAKVYGIPSYIQLSAYDRRTLFGDRVADAAQVSGPKGAITLPISAEDAVFTRVFISFTDALKIGLKGLRVFDETRRGAHCTISGPAGEITPAEGAAAPARHLHISEEDAKRLGFADGAYISAIVEGTERSMQFAHILVRVGGEGRA